MEFPSAIITNSITNFLHASALFGYFLIALSSYLKIRSKFSFRLVCMFFVLFFNKVLGVLVHYLYPILSSEILSLLWMFIGLGSLLFSYFLIYSIEIPNLIKRSAILVVFIFVLLFENLTYKGDIRYFLLAISQLISFLVAIFYSRKLARIGLIFAVCSTIFWILARQIGLIYWDQNINVEYTYDNDIYHLMLIVSTYILFLSVNKGCWNYSKSNKII